MIIDKQYEDCFTALAAYEEEVNRKNNRILKAIGNQIGPGYLKDLQTIIINCGCTGNFYFSEDPIGKFQTENGDDVGCITGAWVTQYNVGIEEGDSYEGTICIRLKPYKYLVMPFSI